VVAVKEGKMALSEQRHEEIAASLRRIHQYLTALADEIDAAAPSTDKRGQTYQVALNAATEVDRLRSILQTDLEHRRIGQQSRSSKRIPTEKPAEPHG
jgi:hypothetical protein